MTPRPALSARECLPSNPAGSLLIGRAWIPAEDGPAVIAVRGDDAVDLTGSYPTVSRLLDTARPRHPSGGSRPSSATARRGIAIRRGRGSSLPAISRR